jgi:hypothetical protein
MINTELKPDSGPNIVNKLSNCQFSNFLQFLKTFIIGNYILYYYNKSCHRALKVYQVFMKISMLIIKVNFDNKCQF